MTNGQLRIGGATYNVLLTRERQVMNGRESMVSVDAQAREIRLSSHVRSVLAGAVAAAREIERRPAVAAARVPYGEPIMVSGCFPCHLLPFPWWR